MVLKQVFLIHPIKFVCNAVKEFAKQELVTIYDEQKINDFGYLINDLKPELIAIHADLVAVNYTEFKKVVDNLEFKDFELVLIGRGEQISSFEYCSEFHHFLFEPYNPSEFTASMKSFLASSKNKH